MMVGCDESIVIAKPRAEVAAFVCDHANDLRWIGAINESTLVSDGPFGVGARVRRTANFLGRTMVYTNEVSELEEGERLTMRSVEAPFPMTVVYHFSDDAQGCRVRIETSGDADGFYRIAGPLLSQAVSRGVKGDLRRLKKALESA